MRYDSQGLFWHDQERVRGSNGPRMPTPGPIPETGWSPPSTFPNLAAAKVISIDVETYDPNLLTHGPGFVRQDGFVAGVSIGADHDGRWYFPLAHQGYTEHNFDPQKVFSWLSSQLSGSQPIIGANLFYDVGWLEYNGVEINGRLIDVQYAEPLLDENRRSYSLERLCLHHGLTGKIDDLLNEWCAQAFGGKASRGDQIKNYYRAPPQLVGPYAESDVDQPILIWEKQEPLLRRDGLLDLFDMECKLIRILLKMYHQGVRVDIDKVPAVQDSIEQLLTEKKKIIPGVDIWSAANIAHFMDVKKIDYPKTAKGNPSFTAPWLEAQDNIYCQALRDARKYDKIVGTFIKGHILDKEHNGIIHTSFHPLRSDKGGTVSGRFSSSNPNLQQIPSRDPVLAPLIRSLFIPFEGDKQWRRYDYSQIEYRLLVHYAVGRGADAVRQTFNDDPTTDFHELTGQLIERVTGIVLERKATKNINFGLVYGMGLKKLAASLNLSMEAAQRLLDAYFEGTPFVHKTFDLATERASQRGYVRTILGRRRRFAQWEPRDYKLRKQTSPLFDRAELLRLIKTMPGGRKGVQRAAAHKALNSVMQGGSADMIKKAMVDADEAGIFDITGVPSLTIHDELDFSDKGTTASSEAYTELLYILEHAIELKIPVLADCEIGPDWGNLHKLKP